MRNGKVVNKYFIGGTGSEFGQVPRRYYEAGSW